MLKFNRVIHLGNSIINTIKSPSIFASNKLKSEEFKNDSILYIIGKIIVKYLVLSLILFKILLTSSLSIYFLSFSSIVKLNKIYCTMVDKQLN